jgi:LmbE family N-acetylglucosaminyl deacetylase
MRGAGFIRVEHSIIALSVAFMVITSAAAQQKQAPPLSGPDNRYKADLLVVVAHPDDESGDIAGLLARLIYDQHRTVAVIFINRGQRAANSQGEEKGNALGAEREIEGRKALASLGVANVWFLGTPNVSTQNVLNALEEWGHGSVLEQVVRLVRLTRPEVILTWLPDYVAGENHADHQASSVIANEAFDVAGDPSVFGEQLVAGFPGEGLLPWQPKKIYYFSDTSDYPDYGEDPRLPSPYRKPILDDDKGPKYSNTEMSPTHHVTYSRLAALETSFYLTQLGKVGADALKQNDFREFERPARLIFGKSLVGGSTTGEVFENITPGAIPFVRPAPLRTSKQEGISLELGGPWEFYREFWKAHNIEHLANLLSVPEMALRPDVGYIQIPLVVRNSTDKTEEVAVTAPLPDHWLDKSRYNSFPLRSGEVYPVRIFLAPADPSRTAWQEITWSAEVGGQRVATVTLRVLTGARAMPQ